MKKMTCHLKLLSKFEIMSFQTCSYLPHGTFFHSY